MKHLRKISVLFLALIMVLTMGASVFAAGSDNTFNGGTTKGQAQDNADRSGESLGTNNTLVFEKGIKLVDADDKFYIPNVPNLVFTYTVTAPEVAEGTKVSDGLTATTVRQGVGTVSVSAVDTANQFTNGVKFVNNDSSNAISNVGSADDPVYIVTEKLKLDFTRALSAATQPGVYRYKVTETATLKGNDANKGYDYSKDVDVTDVTTGDARFVDMYVRWKADDPTKLEVYGYTMFKGDPTYSSTNVPNDITANDKTDGFTYDTSTTSVTLNDNKTAEDKREYTQADESGITTYTTYDLVVRKTVTGAMADKSREFDIDVLIDKLPNDDKVYYKANDEATYTSASAAIEALKLTAAQTAVGGGATEGGTVSGNKVSVNGMPTFKHDQYAVIKGIPSGYESDTPTKYDVMEESAATETDGYTMSYKKNSINADDPTDSYADIVANHGNIASGQSALTATFEMAKAASTNAFYVDNNLKAISPTNVVMRYAPYLFILGGAALLLVVSRRRKAEQE